MQTYPSERRRVWVADAGDLNPVIPNQFQQLTTVRKPHTHNPARPRPWRRPATDHDATPDRRQAPERLPELGRHEPQQPQTWDLRVHRWRRVRLARVQPVDISLPGRSPPSPACARTSWTCIAKRRVVVSCPAHPPPIVRPADLALPSSVTLCPPCGGAVGTRPIVSPPLQYGVLPSHTTPPDHPLLPTSRLLNHAPLHSPPPPCASPEPHLQGTPGGPLQYPLPPHEPFKPR